MMNLMNHPDNMATNLKESVDYDFAAHRQDRLGKRSSAHTGRGHVGAARTINDIMADMERGDEKTVVTKSLGGSGADLDKQALKGSTEMTTGDDGLTVHRLNSQDGYSIGFANDADIEDVDDVAEDADLLAIYDGRGASAEWSNNGDSWPDDNGFLEDSRTYDIPNVVVEVERNDHTRDLNAEEPTEYADRVDGMLGILGYDDSAVRHDVTYGNDFVWASEGELQ
ncbi:MAG: hypothetical protein H8Z69_05355 [Nanohaloarchaea archaeon]|nr:hypothetical protein [Candidatus Nanohaloarchaea archaeon]